jgi:hypothetical protein
MARTVLHCGEHLSEQLNRQAEPVGGTALQNQAVLLHVEEDLCSKASP